MSPTGNNQDLVQSIDAIARAINATSARVVTYNDLNNGTASRQTFVAPGGVAVTGSHVSFTTSDYPTTIIVVGQIMMTNTVDAAMRAWIVGGTNGGMRTYYDRLNWHTHTCLGIFDYDPLTSCTFYLGVSNSAGTGTISNSNTDPNSFFNPHMTIIELRRHE